MPANDRGDDPRRHQPQQDVEELDGRLPVLAGAVEVGAHLRRCHGLQCGERGLRDTPRHDGHRQREAAERQALRIRDRHEHGRAAEVIGDTVSGADDAKRAPTDVNGPADRKPKAGVGDNLTGGHRRPACRNRRRAEASRAVADHVHVLEAAGAPQGGVEDDEGVGATHARQDRDLLGGVGRDGGDSCERAGRPSSHEPTVGADDVDDAPRLARQPGVGARHQQRHGEYQRRRHHGDEEATASPLEVP
jgi:hypothetical protein